MTDNILMFSIVTGGIIYALGGIIIKIYKKNKLKAQLKEEVKKNDLAYSETKDNAILKKIAKIMKIEKESIKLADTQEIKQGDRVSFNTYKYGYVTGQFVGTKTAMASEYSEILIVRINDSKILQAPLEYIMLDTINVYGR